MRWVLGIALSLALVVAVNVLAVWLAVSDPPVLVESYAHQDRR